MPSNSIRHVASIPLVRYLDGSANRRKNSPTIVVAYALVDDVDARWIGQREWKVGKQRGGRTRYAFRNTRGFGKSFRISMHHEIWENCFGRIPDGFTIDHADQDGLNNQIANLRLATKSQQGRNQKIHRRNTSGYRGVVWDRFHGTYNALVRVGELYFLGSYPTREEAAVAYNHGSLKLGGEYAWFNKIPDGIVSDERKAEIIALVDNRYLPRISKAMSETIERTHTLRPDGTVSKHRVRRDSKTGYRGVTKEMKVDLYRAAIRHKGQLIFLGNYAIKEEGAVAYNYVSPILFGNKARLNVIPDNIVSAARRIAIIAKLESRYLPRAGIEAAEPRPSGMLF